VHHTMAGRPNRSSPETDSSAPLSLADLADGQHGTVVGFAGGNGLVCRLAALGFTPGAPLPSCEIPAIRP